MTVVAYVMCPDSLAGQVSKNQDGHLSLIKSIGPKMSDLTKTLTPLTQFIHNFLKARAPCERSCMEGPLRVPFGGTAPPNDPRDPRHFATTAVRRSLCRQAELCGALEPVHGNGSSLSHWDIAVLFIDCNATNSLER